MKRGTEYELLTKGIYQILLDSKWSGSNFCVQHDIKLKGSSGQEHQIDVYWEYEVAGTRNKVAIECKDYTKPISLGKVRDFFGVLYDLQDVKGIMVAANGFQKGAKEYAQYYGITLKELTISDEDPVVAEIETHFHTSLRRLLYMIDEEWAKENGWNVNSYRENISMMSMAGSEWVTAKHLPLQTTDPIIIDSTGNKVSSIEELELASDSQMTSGNRHAFPFEDAFVMTKFGHVRIKEVLIIDKEDDRSNTISLVAEGFVKAILKDAIDGTIQNVLYPQTES